MLCCCCCSPRVDAPKQSTPCDPPFCACSCIRSNLTYACRASLKLPCACQVVVLGSSSLVLGADHSCNFPAISVASGMLTSDLVGFCGVGAYKQHTGTCQGVLCVGPIMGVLQVSCRMTRLLLSCNTLRCLDLSGGVFSLRDCVLLAMLCVLVSECVSMRLCASCFPGVVTQHECCVWVCVCLCWTLLEGVTQCGHCCDALQQATPPCWPPSKPSSSQLHVAYGAFDRRLCSACAEHTPRSVDCAAAFAVITTLLHKGFRGDPNPAATPTPRFVAKACT